MAAFADFALAFCKFSASMEQSVFPKATFAKILTEMEKLHILCTTDNRDNIFNMVASYSTQSLRQGWWNEVNVILWGAAVKLTGTDIQVQAEMLEMIHQGVTIEACENCCTQFGVTEVLSRLGITIRGMGLPVTGYLKAGENMISV
jgi:hypothetical protein